MNCRITFLLLTALLFSACLSPHVEKTPLAAGDIATPDQSGGTKLTQAGEKFITSIKSEGIGNIAVEVTLPGRVRYPEGAGIVVEVQPFVTERTGFYTSLDATKIGLIHVSYLWPGLSDRSGAKSDGDYDYARENGMQALRDVIHYSAGRIPDVNGKYLKDSIAIIPLTDNLGLYAFSHPGIAATRVVALYGDQLPEVKYIVGRENPTVDMLVSVEVGYFDDENNPILNPFYEFPQDYSPLQIDIDYSKVRWDSLFKSDTFVGRPYFDLNQNGLFDGGDHALNHRVPAPFDKRLYSVKLTHALLDNGALNPSNWPSDVATPQETAQWWPFWTVVDKYPALKSQSPNLKVMLVFADRDHVQPAPDKPHIHQAYDGFHNTASLWTRLNPDEVYILWADPSTKGKTPDNDANTEPIDWLMVKSWSYKDKKGANTAMPLAGVAEMADRVYTNNWDDNLIQLLVDAPSPNIKP